MTASEVSSQPRVACAVMVSAPHEYDAIGALMVRVYGCLAGFPSASEQPEYYKMLAAIGDMAAKSGLELLVAKTLDDRIAGAVLLVEDMAAYGAGCDTSQLTDASGFRLLAVDSAFRGQGIGRQLIEACIAHARRMNRRRVVIHSTEAMQDAQRLYSTLGFVRYPELDFMQASLPVYGFMLRLS